MKIINIQKLFIKKIVLYLHRQTTTNMENLKLVHQLFSGKVADEIGDKRAMELLKEARVK